MQIDPKFYTDMYERLALNRMQHGLLIASGVKLRFIFAKVDPEEENRAYWKRWFKYLEERR